MNNQTHNYLFHNKTPRDIQLAYWVNRNAVLSVQEYQLVESGTIVPLPHCNLQEWIILSTVFERLGKFRTQPALDGSWFWCDDDYTLVKDENPLGGNCKQNIIRMEFNNEQNYPHHPTQT